MISIFILEANVSIRSDMLLEESAFASYNILFSQKSVIRSDFPRSISINIPYIYIYIAANIRDSAEHIHMRQERVYLQSGIFSLLLQLPFLFLQTLAYFLT